MLLRGAHFLQGTLDLGIVSLQDVSTNAEGNGVKVTEMLWVMAAEV